MTRLAGVIVAGGRARRLGQAKGLVLVAGVPAIERLIEAYRAARVSPIVVVTTGPALRLVQGLAEGAADLVAVASDPDGPMVDSVARGLAMIPGDREGAIVQPVDAPFTTPEMIAALGPGERPRVLCHQAVPGHPIMLPTSYFLRVMERPEGGLRALLAEADVELVEWPDARVLADLDTPEDLARWGAALADG